MDNLYLKKKTLNVTFNKSSLYVCYFYLHCFVFSLCLYSLSAEKIKPKYKTKIDRGNDE